MEQCCTDDTGNAWIQTLVICSQNKWVSHMEWTDLNLVENKKRTNVTIIHPWDIEKYNKKLEPKKYIIIANSYKTASVYATNKTKSHFSVNGTEGIQMWEWYKHQ